MLRVEILERVLTFVVPPAIPHYSPELYEACVDAKTIARFHSVRIPWFWKDDRS